jgi:hypothetical protein
MPEFVVEPHLDMRTSLQERVLEQEGLRGSCFESASIHSQKLYYSGLC